MESKKYTDPILLFPNYFKKIGIAILIVAALFAIAMIAMYSDPTQNQKELFKTVTATSFTLGLFFIVNAKEKQEDERTYNLRLQAMSRSFTFVVICAVVDQIFSLFNENILYHSVQYYILMMLVIYLLSYYSRKTAI